MKSIEDEVARLIAQATAPGIKLPRSTAEMHLALMSARGSGMSRLEAKLRNQASQLGGVRLAGELEEALLGGASTEELQVVIDQAASQLASEMARSDGAAGTEAARILRDRAARSS